MITTQVGWTASDHKTEILAAVLLCVNYLNNYTSSPHIEKKNKMVVRLVHE